MPLQSPSPPPVKIGAENPLVVVVHSYRQGNFGPVLTDDILVKCLLYLLGAGKSFKRERADVLFLRQTVVNQFLAGIHAEITDIKAGRRRNQEIDLILVTAAKRAKACCCFIVAVGGVCASHAKVPLFGF